MEDNQFDPLLLTDVPSLQLQYQHQPKHELRFQSAPVVSFQTSAMAESDDLCFNKIEEISLQNRPHEAVSAKDCMNSIGNDVLDEVSWRNSSSGATDVLNDKNVKEEISWDNSSSEVTRLEDDIKVKKEIKWRTSISETIGTEDVVVDEDVTKRLPDLVLCSSSPEGTYENGCCPNEDIGSLEASFELLSLASRDENDDELMKVKRALEMMKRENEYINKECEEAKKSLRELQNELMRKSMHVGSLAFAVEGQVKEKSKWFSSLRDMSRKLKIMKMDQIKLLEDAEAYKKHAADMSDISCIIQSKINEQVTQHEDLKIKFNQGAKERKELYNKIQDLKGNIRVYCRCRPLNSKEIGEGASVAFDFEDGELRVKSFKKTFKFDSVFSPEANQGDVFEETSSFATSVLDGYNVCIFAYGQTGTGKTFTMEGTHENRGVNFRTLEELFRVINERKNEIRYEIRVSVMEVYNEQIRDLLAAKRVEIRQGGGLAVEAQVKNMSEVWDVLKTGSASRAVGSTNGNEHSSRSHCIHRVMVKGENLVSGESTRSKLWLVDLAGSERVAKTEVQAERLKETQNINRSLSALGDVISALATKTPHIPFRNSKLTHLLQDSLGGDSKTLMFVQISPNENDLSESLCSLNFASRVRGIEFPPAKKQIESSQLLKYKQMAERLKHEMKNKDLLIKKLEDGLDIKLKEKDLKNKILQDKVKELESQLLVERQHVIAEQRQQDSRQPLAASKLLNTHDDNENHYQTMKIIQQKPDLVDEEDDIIININDMEKENNPIIPKRLGRASICTTTTQRVPVRPRRNSLMIPLPTRFVPLIEHPSDTNNNKKTQIRKGALNVAVDRVRISIGSRGARLPHRPNANGGRRTKQQNCIEKERRWNIGK